MARLQTETNIRADQKSKVNFSRIEKKVKANLDKFKSMRELNGERARQVNLIQGLDAKTDDVMVLGNADARTGKTKMA